MHARTRSTPYAILGMLSIAPMSGYDVRKEATTSIGYFWSESYGQIYPALRDLASAGLIRRCAGRRVGGRERQVYAITARGRDALRQWRSEPPRTGPLRNELLLKLFFGDETSIGRDADWVAQLLFEEKAHLAEFGRIRHQLMRERHGHPSLPFWLITLSYGEYRSRAVVRWCCETLSVLRSKLVRTGKENRRNV